MENVRGFMHGIKSVYIPLSHLDYLLAQPKVTYKRVLVRRGERKDYVNELCPQCIFKIGGEKHR